MAKRSGCVSVSSRHWTRTESPATPRAFALVSESASGPSHTGRHMKNQSVSPACRSLRIGFHAGSGEHGRDTVIRARHGALEAQQQAHGLTGLVIAQPTLGRLARSECDQRGSRREVLLSVCRGDGPCICTDEQCRPATGQRSRRSAIVISPSPGCVIMNMAINPARRGWQPPVRVRSHACRPRSAAAIPNGACCTQCK